MLRTLEEAAAWIDRVGLALIYPNGDYVLPSLWEAVAGDTDVHWAVRDEEGKFVSFTPEMERVWTWKDELPARKLACVGLHLARTSGAVAPALVAPLYALTGRRGAPDDFRDADVEGLARELAEAALAPLEGETPASRERLSDTLLAWLRHRGRTELVAEALHVHPQTVRYRLGRLRELYGERLDDPDVRFELELALRSSQATARGST